MTRLDYPKENLFVVILLEEDDRATIEAIKRIELPQFIQYVIVPEGKPKTKPRACNYGLQYLKHCEYVTIYDAEDIPEPDQLRKAVSHFEKGDDKLACVQASLKYRNGTENVLTRLFFIEYVTWFEFFINGLSDMKLPIPLGGTSNHLKYKVLTQLGSWNAFNVTEDADLGLRIYGNGYTVEKLDSITWEESVLSVWPWIKQRTRWMKGYIQTYFDNRNKYKSSPLSHKISNALFIFGTPFVGLWTIPLYLITVYSFFFSFDIGNQVDRYAALIALLFGNGSMILVSMFAVRKEPKYIPFCLLLPFYWILHSAASWRALMQYFTDPHKWEKTEHGLTTVKENE